MNKVSVMASIRLFSEGSISSFSANTIMIIITKDELQLLINIIIIIMQIWLPQLRTLDCTKDSRSWRNWSLLTKLSGKVAEAQQFVPQLLRLPSNAIWTKISHCQQSQKRLHQWASLRETTLLAKSTASQFLSLNHYFSCLRPSL